MAGVDTTSLKAEIAKILASPTAGAFYHITAEVVVTTTDNRTLRIPLRQVNSLDVIRDYAGSYCDLIYLEGEIGLGTYAYDIYPYKNNLKINLTRRLLSENGASQSGSEVTQTFAATLWKDFNPVVESPNANVEFRRNMDLENQLTIQFQLLDQTIQKGRLFTIGGVYRGQAPGDVIKYFLTDVSQKVDVDDNERVLGVDMVDPDNTGAMDNFVIDHGTPFEDGPDLVNRDGGALYNTGFGFYLQARRWFVYPLFDLTRFEKEKRTLTLIIVPSNRLPRIERSFRRTAYQTVALVTGDVKHNDPSERAQLNRGNAARFIDGRRIFDGYATVENNKATIKRSDNVNEFSVEKREDKLNNTLGSAGVITSNAFYERGKLASRLGAQIDCVWENSNPDYVYPGMPVKVMYTANEQIIERVGVVQKAYHFFGATTLSPTNSRHACSTALTLFVEKLSDQ